MDALIWANFTSKTIELHLKYVLPFSAMDETPADRSSDLAEKLSTKDSRSICKENTHFFTSEKMYWFNCDIFTFNAKSIHGCV